MGKPTTCSIWDSKYYCYVTSNPSTLHVMCSAPFSVQMDQFHSSPIETISTFISSSCYFLIASSADSTVSYAVSTIDSTISPISKVISSFAPTSTSPPMSSSLSPCKTAFLACCNKSMSIFVVSPNFGLNAWASNVPVESAITACGFMSANTDANDEEKELLLILITTEDGHLKIFDAKRKILLASVDGGTASNAKVNNIQLNSSPIAAMVATNVSDANGLVATACNDGEITLYQVRSERDVGVTVNVVLNGNYNKLYIGHDNTPIPLDMTFFKITGKMKIAITTSKEVIVMDCLSGDFHSCGGSYSVFVEGAKKAENENNNNMFEYSKAAVNFPFVCLISAFLPSVEFYSCADYMNELAAFEFNVKVDSVASRRTSYKSIIATEEPPEQSVLIASPTKESQNWATKGTVNETTGIPPKSQTLFASRFSGRGSKSSGYGTLQPTMKLGQSPSMALKRQKQAIMKRKQKEKLKAIERSNMQYPINCEVLTNPQTQNDYTDPANAPIQHLTFNPLASSLAITYNDFSLQICKLPFKSFITQPSQQKAPFIPRPETTPHSTIKHPPRPIFSHLYNNELLSYGNKIYNIQKSNGKEAIPSICNFGENANHAAWFYNDKFCVISKDNEIKVCKLKLSRVGGGSTSQGHLQAQSKVVQKYSHEGANTILALACINTSLSHLIASSASDKSLTLSDVATGKSYWSVKAGCGSRAAHCIALPNVSCNVGLPAECYCLLACSSTDSGGLVKLWDVRSGTPAAQLRGHVNRREVCNVSFSPCMRYISCGSEDQNGAVVYDLRGGGGEGESNTIVGRCRKNFKDGSIVDVQYNPIYPQMCTGSTCGVVKFYSE